MADSPVFVPSGAAVPTSPTPSESRAASPDGVETDPAQHCRDRDITEIDGEALGQSAQLSMAAAPVNWAGSIDSGRGQSSPMRGQQVQATSSLHSGAASASCAVSTRSAAEHGVPAERPSQPASELTKQDLEVLWVGSEFVVLVFSVVRHVDINLLARYNRSAIGLCNQGAGGGGW